MLRLPAYFARIGVGPEQNVAAWASVATGAPVFLKPLVITSSDGVTRTFVEADDIALPIGLFDRTDGHPARWPTFGVTVEIAQSAGVVGSGGARVITISPRNHWPDLSSFDLPQDMRRRLFDDGRRAVDEFLARRPDLAGLGGADEDAESADADPTDRPTTASPVRGFPARSGARELLDLTGAIARGRGASEAVGVDVVLAAFARAEHTALDRAELERGATHALVCSLAEPPAAAQRVQSALAWVGVGPGSLERIDRRTPGTRLSPRWSRPGTAWSACRVPTSSGRTTSLLPR